MSREPPAAMDTRPVLRRVVGNAGLLLGGRAVNAVLGLGYTALAARALGVREFGALVLIHAFAEFLGDVVKFESWQTVLRYGAHPLVERRVSDFQRVLRFALLLDLLSSLVAVAIGVTGALLFGSKLGWSREHDPAAAIYVLSVVFMVSAAPVGLMRLFDRFDVMARQTAFVSLVRLIGCAVAFFTVRSMPAFLTAWAAGTLAGFVYLGWETWREAHRRELLADFRWRGSPSQGLPGVWSFAWNTNLATTLSVAFTHVVTLMVGAMLGPAQAALWRVGRQVADAIAKPARLLLPALYPEFARLRVDQGEAVMWRLGMQVAGLGGLVGLVLLVASAFAGAPLLGLLMGHEFVPAANVMTWQVAAAVVGIFALPLEPMLISLGEAAAVVWVRVAGAIVFLAALPFVVERFGIEGAGAALTGSSVALGLGMLFCLLRRRPKAAPEEAACDPAAPAGKRPS